jgi:hypothetical protein
MIYICGDSFGVPDSEYGPCWVDYLRQQHEVVNLSQVGASNLLIAQQLDQTVGADFVIVLFTSCTRGQVRRGNRIVPFSLHRLDPTTTLNDYELQILKAHTAEFFDLELAVYQNQLTIEASLQRLVDRKQRFLFDQGGFEHPSFSAVGTDYFDKFNQYRSEYCLWDYTQTRNLRPYYHVTDTTTHKNVADYYAKKA